MEMRDVASERDDRGITINQVGIRDLHLPVRIRQKNGGAARIVGVFDATVELPHYERGTHMSRTVAVLLKWSKRQVSQHEMEDMLRELQQVFSARAAFLSIRFKYFLDKKTPVSGLDCQLDYDCRFDAKIAGEEFAFALEVEVPVLTVCPCSLQITQTGAHSQRGVVRVRLGASPGVVVWLEDLIPLVEEQGSSGVCPILKREDEKYVVERAFANPKFVEDVVRDTVIAVRSLPGVAWYEVACETYESIHNHNAYAYAAGGGGAWSLR
jgi:GTP cyclohydrolase I